MNIFKSEIFKQMPELFTQGLILRKICMDDKYHLFEYASSKEVTRYLSWSAIKSVAEAAAIIMMMQNLPFSPTQFREWAVVHKESGKMIGTCGFSAIDERNKTAEIGYVINPEYCSRGYATEAARLMIAVAFDFLEMERVEARYMVGNGASRRVAEKCGMTFEGVLKKSLYAKRVYHDVGVCAITREEYYKNNSPRSFPTLEAVVHQAKENAKGKTHTVL